MSFMWRAAFVVAGVVTGATALDYFVLGNAADYVMQNERIGAWREGKVRPACYDVFGAPQKDPLAPRLPAAEHHITIGDYLKTAEMTAALKCYVVTQAGAVCEPNNRAFIVTYIRRYFDKMDEMLRAAEKRGADEVKNVRALWDSHSNRMITAALDDHIRNGRLNKSDFGRTVPAQLLRQLEANKAVPDACSRERPWTPVDV
jgi:hypothetical protein